MLIQFTSGDLLHLIEVLIDNVLLSFLFPIIPLFLHCSLSMFVIVLGGGGNEGSHMRATETVYGNTRDAESSDAYWNRWGMKAAGSGVGAAMQVRAVQVVLCLHLKGQWDEKLGHFSWVQSTPMWCMAECGWVQGSHATLWKKPHEKRENAGAVKTPREPLGANVSALPCYLSLHFVKSHFILVIPWQGVLQATWQVGKASSTQVGEKESAGGHATHLECTMMHCQKRSPPKSPLCNTTALKGGYITILCWCLTHPSRNGRRDSSVLLTPPFLCPYPLHKEKAPRRLPCPSPYQAPHHSSFGLFCWQSRSSPVLLLPRLCSLFLSCCWQLYAQHWPSTSFPLGGDAV